MRIVLLILLPPLLPPLACPTSPHARMRGKTAALLLIAVLYRSIAEAVRGPAPAEGLRAHATKRVRNRFKIAWIMSARRVPKAVRAARRATPAARGERAEGLRAHAMKPARSRGPHAAAVHAPVRSRNPVRAAPRETCVARGVCVPLLVMVARNRGLCAAVAHAPVRNRKYAIRNHAVSARLATRNPAVPVRARVRTHVREAARGGRVHQAEARAARGERAGDFRAHATKRARSRGPRAAAAEHVRVRKRNHVRGLPTETHVQTEIRAQAPTRVKAVFVLPERMYAAAPLMVRAVPRKKLTPAQIPVLPAHFAALVPQVPQAPRIPHADRR